MKMSLIDRNSISKKKLRVSSTFLFALTLVAGVSVASTDTMFASSEKAESSIQARNGGPSLPTIKPSENKSITDTIRQLFS